MTMLRFLRNLAVLVILALAVLVSTPRPVAAGDNCLKRHMACGPTNTLPCCDNLVCTAVGSQMQCEPKDCIQSGKFCGGLGDTCCTGICSNGNPEHRFLCP